MSLQLGRLAYLKSECVCLFVCLSFCLSAVCLCASVCLLCACHGMHVEIRKQPTEVFFFHLVISGNRTWPQRQAPLPRCSTPRLSPYSLHTTKQPLLGLVEYYHPEDPSGKSPLRLVLMLRFRGWVKEKKEEGAVRAARVVATSYLFPAAPPPLKRRRSFPQALDGWRMASPTYRFHAVPEVPPTLSPKTRLVTRWPCQHSLINLIGPLAFKVRSPAHMVS